MFPRTFNPLRLAVILLLAGCSLLLGAMEAQAGGRLDGSFNPLTTIAGGTVSAVTVQADGKILIGGDFISVNGAQRIRIARLNTDGSLDATFNPGTGATGVVRAIVVQADGKILVGGGFISFNSVARSFIARLNTDGSVDTSFNPGAGATSAVNSIVVQADGKIIVGGFFALFNGVQVNFITRLNTDGSLDNSFTTGTGANGAVHAVALQADGKIVIGGAFTTFNNTGRNRIARLNADGSLDNSFAPLTGANNTVNAVALQADQKIVIGGLFTDVNNVGLNRIARLESDGSLDANFNPGTGADNTVNSIAVQANQQILIGGAFTNINLMAANRIARLNTDGSPDPSFNPGTGANNTVNAVAVQADQQVLIGGTFTSVNGLVRNGIARLSTTGSVDATFNPVLVTGGMVNAVALQADQKILIGGNFTDVNGVGRNFIARLNTDGSLDTTFNPGTGANATVNSIAVQADGKILVGGNFTTINGVGRVRIARLETNGSLDTTFNPGTGANSTVRSIALQADQKIVIGGNFSVYNNTSRGSIARLETNGLLDTNFNPGTGANGTVTAVAVQADQKIVVVGSFPAFNNVPENFIARLETNGSLDNSFAAAGADAPVSAVALQTDGKILIGGIFNNVNNVGRSRVARFETNGSLDNFFHPGTGTNSQVNTIAVQADGKIVIGGNFSFVNGVRRNFIARLNADGSLDATFNPGTGADGPVLAVAVQADGKILIGGAFITVNNTPHLGLARLLGTGQFPADFDGDNRADITVWNPTNHNWYILQSSNNTPRVQLDWGNGSLGDVAVPGDYDGDSKTDIAVYRPSEGNWYIILSTTNTVSLRNWGISTDTPVPADYDGDGTTDIAVWRGSEGNWYIIKSNNGSPIGTVQNWGISTDKPVPADYDGDGRADIAVFRASEGNWYIIKSNNGSPAGFVQNWGASGDKLVPADYDGDGKTDIAVWRSSEGNWYIRNSATNTVTVRGWGASGDIPVPADYDGDGRADIAVWRGSEGNWYIIRSFTGAAQVQYLGGNGDVPAPSAYLPQ